MDVLKPRFKTASNGSLHSTYTSYGSHFPPSTGVPRGQFPHRRRALRNASHNSILPPSPGPLTSMLKTTTETGDISIFSIQPPVTPAAYHQYPRARPDILDGAPPAKYTPKKGENFYYADDHRHFRSYRDTASEIISLYGYDSQPFYMTPGSPMFDDISHRSYSITTNSSRQLPSQKSSGTLQSQSSRSGLQRPRSPFPYPTRLKRPGVRPASPAVAENGCIDYNRMIELDRVSQRTVHGSYKSTCNNWVRRPPPLSLRSDFNRSTASLPSRASPGPYYPGHMPHRSRTPGSSQSGTSRHGRFERHARMPVDRCGRSPSLTSIVDMYRRPSTAKVSRQPPQMAGSFYYDYSEDFDRPAEFHHEIRGQISMELLAVQHDDGQNYDELAVESKPDGPVPQDAATDNPIPHPCPGLECCAENEGQLEPGQKVEEVTRSSEADDTELSNLIAARSLSQSAPADPEPAKSAKGQLPGDENNMSVNRARVSKSDTCQSPRAEGDWPKSDCHASTIGAQQGSDKARSSLDPTLPDFASIFSSFDLLGRSPCFRAADISARKLSGDSDADSVASSNHDLDNLRHRRNVAAVRISTTDLNDKTRHVGDGSVHEQELDILSPEPISPARELKVKNSIPQLMKALPPLPPGVPSGRSHNKHSFRRWDDQLFDQRSGDCPRPHGIVQENDEVHLADMMPSGLKQQPQSVKNSSPSKFKVRIKPSCSPIIGSGDANRADTKGDVHEWPHPSTSQAKPRLKLKLSRSQIGQGRPTTGEPCNRVNRLKQCNSLADLALYSNVGTKIGQRSANEEKARVNTQSEGCVHSIFEAQHGQNSTGDKSPQPSDPFSIPYPPSPEDKLSKKRSLSSSNKDTLVQRPSFSSDRKPVQENGLRKKMSMFRMRIAESLTARPYRKCKKIRDLEQSDSHISINMTLKGSEKNLKNIDKDTPRSSSNNRSDWVTDRVKRWAMDARRALRSYVRRTLDGSSRWSE
ncbi:uncharacterized protein MAM_05715 [Metarhizium album ARSEF 1941]|uniref:Uncharacterized protein n=1 Tax=Metarhizium album (strain ARSEF 1941) TaxID=1081103 RepID=A0A0B2WK41_METAS|nr:uncharacterized protein MAM_05715 [Metarhizium album ARSEF 1941]KHN96426.1 hypothetical protein MAM_05715 [Metarhizium album ARSEF 1941]